MQPQAHDADAALRRLGQLIQLEYDTMAAYRAVIDRLDNSDAHARGELALFFEDHEANARAFSSCAERYGGEPHAGGDLERAWINGRKKVTETSDTRELLGVLAHLEDDVRREYERAQTELRGLADPPLAFALDSALADDEQHRAWLTQAGERARA